MSLNKWYNKSKLTDDPIAQTFRILPEHCPDADGLYCTSADVFFQAKDAFNGVSVDIREVQNGLPTRTILGEIHLLAKHIKLSSTGTVPTRAIFNIPVFLKAGRTYALAIRPDGGTPNIKVWYSKTGENELASGEPVTSNWGDGALFLSSANAWQPILDSDLKFRLNKGKYNPSNVGIVNLVNEDLEFLTINNVSGTLKLNEEIYKVPATFANGTVTLSKASSIVTGVSTVFTSSFQSGDTIVVRSSANNNIADVVTIKSIESDTSMTILGSGRIGIASANAAKTPTGILTKYDTTNDGNRLVIGSSTATTGNLFANGDSLKGTESTATFDIVTVDNSVISYFQPHLYRTEPTGTSIISNVKVIDTTAPATSETKQIIYGVNNRNTEFTAAVFSKSNEIRDNSGAKSFVVETKFKTKNAGVTPALDSKFSMAESYEAIINNSVTNERIFGQGLASSKYISKAVTLAAGMEAEDLNTYVTGYRPANTNLDVYAMFTSPDDHDKMIEKQWTKLTLNDAQRELFSASDSVNDFKEFKYNVPSIPTIEDANRSSGVATTEVANTIVSGSGANNTNYSAGDIMIVTDGIPSNYVIGRVASANTTAVVLDQAADKEFITALHYKVNTDEKQSAFLYPQADGSYKIRYFDATGREHENFKHFQLKIVFRAEQQYRVPKVADVRAIALTA